MILARVEAAGPSAQGWEPSAAGGSNRTGSAEKNREPDSSPINVKEHDKWLITWWKCSYNFSIVFRGSKKIKAQTCPNPKVFHQTGDLQNKSSGQGTHHFIRNRSALQDLGLLRWFLIFPGSTLTFRVSFWLIFSCLVSRSEKTCNGGKFCTLSLPLKSFKSQQPWLVI